MTIELRSITVAELHAQLANLVANGHGNLPVCATDCRARYPFQIYTVPNPSGFLDALLVYVRPDAHFAQREPLPTNWGPDRVTHWNEAADEIKRRCGAFADRHLPDVASTPELRTALERIHDSTKPEAEHNMPELRGLTEFGYARWVASTAGRALGRDPGQGSGS